MATGWSIAMDSNNSPSPMTSSGSFSVPVPAHKRQALGPTSVVPAMPVVYGNRVHDVAEGNLVQASFAKDSDEQSMISAASSNRMQVLKAKQSLQQALINEARKETEMARLQLEIAESMPIEDLQMQEPDNLSRDLSELMKQDELLQETARMQELARQENFRQQEMARLAKEKQDEIARLEAAKQAELERVYQETINKAMQEATQEQNRVYQELAGQFNHERERMTAEVKDQATKAEVQAFNAFMQGAEEQHQMVMQQELAQAQNMSSERLQKTMEECDQRHREIVAQEQSQFREQATQKIEQVEHQSAQLMKQQRQEWEQHAQSAASRIREEATVQWQQQENVVQQNFQAQSERIRQLEEVLNKMQQDKLQHDRLMAEEMAKQQQQAYQLLMQRSEQVKNLEERLQDRLKYGATLELKLKEEMKLRLEAQMQHTTKTPPATPTLVKQGETSSQGSRTPMQFRMDQHSPRISTPRKVKVDKSDPFYVSDWTFGATTPPKVQAEVPLARPILPIKIMKTQIAVDPEGHLGKVSGSARIRSHSVGAKLVKDNKTPPPNPTPPDPPSSSGSKEKNKDNKTPKKTKRKEPSPPPSPDPSDYEECIGDEEEEEEEGGFEDDEEVDPNADGNIKHGKGSDVNRATAKLLKLLSKEESLSSSSKDRKREAEKVNFAAIPETATGFRAWKNSARTEIGSASGKGEVAFRWALEVEDKAATFDSLANSGQYESLDAKIASALSKLAKGELGRVIVQQQEIAAQKGKMLKGRQILFLVYQHFAVSAEAGSLYSITDLMSVRLNDDKIESFLNSWNHVLAGMEVYPPEHELEELFTEQLRFSKLLKDEISHYDRHPKGHPDHTYEYLMRQAKAFVDRDRKRLNRNQIKKALKGTGKGQPSAPGVKGNGKGGKGKGERGKSKGKGGKGNGKGQQKKVCFEWRDKGTCSKGRDCPYSDTHNNQNKKQGGAQGKGGKKNRSDDDGKKKLCHFFQQGSCKMGDDCKFSHEANNNAAPAEAKKKKRFKKKKKAGVSAPAVFAPLIASALVVSTDAKSTAVQPGETLSTHNARMLPFASTMIQNQAKINLIDNHLPCVPACAKDTIKAISTGSPRKRGGKQVSNQNSGDVVKRVQKFMALAATFMFGPCKWLMDTGSPFDLVGKNEIPKSYADKHSQEASFDITLNTANGETIADKTLELQVAPLGETVNPFLLTNTPAVLSVGRRCMIDGYTFIWKPYKKPYLISPNGYRIDLEVENFVPYLREYFKQDSAPAEASVNAGGNVEQAVDHPAPEPEVVQIQEDPEAHDSQGEPSADDLLDRLAKKKLTKSEMKIFEESKTMKHMLCHMPQNPFCEVCRKAKLKKASSFKGKPENRNVAKKFGEKLHADHVTVSDRRDYGIEDERVALALKDDAIGLRGFYPQATKSADETLASIRHFLGKVKLTTLRSDNSKELIAVAKELKVLHETSTPLTPQANTRIERDIQEELKGTRANLQQSGLDSKFWPYAAQHWCHYANCFMPFSSGKPLADMPANSKTPWFSRHNAVWDGPNAPFGCMVDFRTPDSKRFHKSKFEANTQPGLYLGVYLQPGTQYKGDVLVVPLEDFTKDMRPRIVRLKAAEVRFPVIEYNPDGTPKPLEFKFPLRFTKDQDLLKRIKSNKHEPEMIEDEQDAARQEEIPAPDVGKEGGFEEIAGIPNESALEPIQEEQNLADESRDWDIKSDDASRPIENRVSQQGGGSSSSSSAPPVLQPATPPALVKPVKAYGGARGSKRPPHIWPAETWTWMSKRQKEAAIKEWEEMSDEQRSEATKFIAKRDEACPAMAVLNFEEEQEDTTHPAMPRVTSGKEEKYLKHREKHAQHNVFNVMVARTMTRTEMESTPKGLAAIEKEWSSHRKRGTWDESSVREWKDVSQEAKEKNQKAGKEVIKVHVASLMEVNVEKNSELPIDDPRRKYKCRVVYRGDNTRDELGVAAVFNELGSAPATMEAAKAADSYGLFPNNSSETSDAEMAYTQAKLQVALKLDDGNVVQLITWVRLPKARWPKGWEGKYKDPVVKLVLALYGHPDAGGCWEQHCNTEMMKVGFTPIPEWQSAFYHKRLELMLIIYVDDLKLAGPSKNLKEGWCLIRSKITTEEPTAASGTKFLGAMHTSYERTIKDGTNPITGICKSCGNDLNKTVTVRVMEYDMRDFLVACVDKYLELTKSKKESLKKATTPFLEVKAEILYEELDEAEKAGGDSKPGVLQPIAARILMKLLYAARMLRYDLLKAISLLASKVTKWTPICDKLLHRLVSYVNSSLDMKLYSWVGDKMEDVHLRLSADADLASDIPSMRSTSGTCLFLAGRNTKAALNARSRKQTAVAHSTPEAELAAVDEGLRNEGLPATELWNVVLKRNIALKLQEDNDACSSIIKTGKNPNIRYMGRTHKINIAWIHESYVSGLFLIERCPSKEMEADILTKPITKPDYWTAARLNLSIAFPSEVKWKPLQQTATPGIPNSQVPMFKRGLIEFCCGNESRIGKLADNECEVVRLTIEHDLTTEAGLRYAKEQGTRLASAYGDVMLWVSIPCTGGSPWQNYNKRFASARLKIADHVRVFNSLWHSLELLANHLRDLQFKTSSKSLFRFWLALEWPKGCSYWGLSKVIQFLQKYGMSNKVRVNGCMVGLKSITKENKLIPKPWDIATNSPVLIQTLSNLICNHTPESHTPCAGKDTRISEEYTDIMVKLIHKGYKQQVQTANKFTGTVAPAIFSPMASSSKASGSAVPNPFTSTVPWDHWLVEQCKLQIGFFHEKLDDQLLGTTIGSLAAASFLERFAREAPHQTGFVRVFSIARQLVGLKQGDRTAGGDTVPQPPQLSMFPLQTAKCEVIGDSFLTMNKAGQKGDATCAHELRTMTGNPNIVVNAMRGATLEQLLNMLKLSRSMKTSFAVMTWTFNDVFARETKRGPLKIVPALPEKTKQLVRELAEVAREFQGFLLVFGADAATWKVDPMFDTYCNEIRDLLDSLKVPHVNGINLARSLEYAVGDDWHSIKNPDNSIKQARFFTRALEMLVGFRPEPAYLFVFENSFKKKWILDADEQTEITNLSIRSRLHPESDSRRTAEERKAPVSSSGKPEAPPLLSAGQPAASSIASSSTAFVPNAIAAPVHKYILGLDAAGEDYWRRSTTERGVKTWWPDEEVFSKKLSQVLRHNREDGTQRFPMSQDGFVACSDVIRELQSMYMFKGLRVDNLVLYTAVRVNAKERFQLRATCSTNREGIQTQKITEIRAVQGHTKEGVDRDSLMERIRQPNQWPRALIHMTFRESLDGIIRNGLLKGGVHHTGKDIFFSPVSSSDPKYVSGMRKSAPIELTFNKNILNDSSFRFYWTASQAIVCTNDKIPASFLLKAVNVHNGLVLFDATAINDREAGGDTVPEEENKTQQKAKPSPAPVTPPLPPSSSSMPPLPKSSAPGNRWQPQLKPPTTPDFMPPKVKAPPQLPAPVEKAKEEPRVAFWPDPTTKSKEETREKDPKGKLAGTNDDEFLEALFDAKGVEKVADEKKSVPPASGNAEQQAKQETKEAEDKDDDSVFEADFGDEEPPFEPPDDRAQCSKCSTFYNEGTLICIECGNELQGQPEGEEGAETIQKRTAELIKEEYGVDVQWIAKLKRTPYISRVRRLTAALHSYDKKAKKGRRNDKGEFVTYESYEDRFEKDATFRANMANCRPPRDKYFREVVKALVVPHKTPQQWKEDLTVREQKRARVQDEGKGKGKGKGKAEGNLERGWQGWQPRADPWWMAGTWSASQSWWSASGEKTGQLVTIGTNPVANIALPPISYMIVYAMIAFFMLIVFYFVVKKINAMLNRWRQRVIDLLEPDLFQYRSVGTQSQTTYDRDNSRFKAYENGFRRAGEVHVEHHRNYKKKTD